eukprot:TRINITY_DN91688_c0_g1_i1.p1 TRINITY_DN91688_c0_g1~~TRINITY_DN91688_c0_g1_i1.p1  ORF type:complete len:501 (+),score=101.69 TRINITY_DN91688_c0_g1_i1:136-1638(+)
MEADGPTASGEGVLVDEASLLLLLRDLVDQRILGHERSEKSSQRSGPYSDPPQTSTSTAAEDLNTRLENLWDLCVDAATAHFLVQNKAVAILGAAASRAGEMQSDAAGASKDGRCAEVCLGALGNICSHKGIVAGFKDDDVAVLCKAALEGISSPHGVVVLQALRLVTALLCGSTAHACSGSLCSQDAVTKYLFVLEHSLLWDALQYSCDVLSQVLVLAFSAERQDGDAGMNTEGLSSALRRLVHERLPVLLTTRLYELAAVAADSAIVSDGQADAHVEAADASKLHGEGEVEAALLSALCLGDSFLSVGSYDTAEALRAVAPLATAGLRAAAVANRPETVAAALDVLASLLDTELAVQHDGEGLGEGLIGSQLAAFARGSHVESVASLVEKVALLLESGDADEAAAAAAFAVLQHAPRHYLDPYRESFAGMLHELVSGGGVGLSLVGALLQAPRAGAAAGGVELDLDFLRWLGVTADSVRSMAAAGMTRNEHLSASAEL